MTATERVCARKSECVRGGTRRRAPGTWRWLSRSPRPPSLTTQRGSSRRDGDGQVMSAGLNLRTRTGAEFPGRSPTDFPFPLFDAVRGRASARGLASTCISGTRWKKMRASVLLLLVSLFNLICSPEASEEEETGLLGLLVDFSGHSSTWHERREVSLLLGATLVPHGRPHTFSARARPQDVKRARRLLGPRVRVEMRHAADKLESRLLPRPSSRRAPDDEHSCDLFVILSGLPTHHDRTPSSDPRTRRTQERVSDVTEDGTGAEIHQDSRTSEQPAEELAWQWYRELRGAAVEGAVAVRASSERKLRVTCARCRECTGVVARWLAAQQETEWVEQVRGLAVRNRMASAALEWGDSRCSGQQVIYDSG